MQHWLPAHGSPHHRGSQQLFLQPDAFLFLEFPGTILSVQQVSLHFFLIFFFLSHLFFFWLHFVSFHFPFLSLHFPEEEPEDTGLGGGGGLAYFCGAFPSHFTYSPSPPGQRPFHCTFVQTFAEFASVCLTQTSWPGIRVPGGHRAAQSGGGGRGGGGGGGGGGGLDGGVEGGIGGALGAPSGGNGGGAVPAITNG